jgi:hypothetical protein
MRDRDPIKYVAVPEVRPSPIERFTGMDCPPFLYADKATGQVFADESGVLTEEMWNALGANKCT